MRIRGILNSLVLTLAFLAMGALRGTVAKAAPDPVEAFYMGKTVTIVVGYAAPTQSNA